MARITVEDCLGNVENLFQLVLLAAQVALREIAAGNITAEMLREPEPAPEAAMPEIDLQSTFRAPQFGLGD